MVLLAHVNPAARAAEKIAQESGGNYDSMMVGALLRALVEKAQAARV